MIPFASRPSLWITTLLAGACVQPYVVSAQAANLIFEDNFNTTALDTTNWTIGYHDPDSGDGVPGAVDQFLLNNSYAGYITEEDVQLHSGSLHLLNQRRPYVGNNGIPYAFTSGQVMSLHKFHFNKGYLEWRAQFPTGRSMWPALWLIAEDLVWGPEWDAFEYFGTRNDIDAEDVMGMHLATGEWPNINWSSHWEHDFDATYDNEAWHVYGFEWTATQANWYVDGQLMHTLPNTIGASWPNEEMYIVMNNGVLSSQIPVDPADFPNSLTIDYVRVWDSKPLGDFDLDGDFDVVDLNAVLALGPVASGVPATGNEEFDLTGDGVIDNADVSQWLADAATANGLGSPYKRGDANLDGVVDASDFNIWNAGKFTSSLFWDRGNFNGDAVTDARDFNIWNANKFTSSDVPSVPEPGAGMLSVAALVVFGAARMRRWSGGALSIRTSVAGGLRKSISNISGHLTVAAFVGAAIAKLAHGIKREKLFASPFD